MEEEIEVGEYIRTGQGYIGKYQKSNEGFDELKDNEGIFGLNINDVVKHSKIISEIIEVGDYVNGKLIHKIDKGPNYCYLYYGNCKTFVNYQIKTIVTKEQMASIEYKVEE